MNESEGDEISLSFVFRSAIRECESNFYSLLTKKKSNLPTAKRKIFFHVLIQNRIIIGKLLVLIRSLRFYNMSKKYFQITEKIDNKSIVRKLKKLKEYFSSEDLSTNMIFSIRMLMQEQFSSTKFTKKPSELQINFRYFWNPIRIKTYKIIRYKKKYVYIENPGFFTARIRLNNDGTTSICSCSTKWPENILPQSIIIKSIIKEILDFNPSDTSFTLPFERKALMFSIISFYLDYTMQFKQHISQFNAELLKKNNLLYIVFPKTFNIDVEFRLEIIEFNIYLTSTHPVYQPPKDYTKIRETINERVSQLSTLAYCVDKTFFVRKMDPNTNILELLCEIRDIYFFTAIKEKWNELVLFMMDIFPFRFPCYFFCKGPTISQTYIRFGSDRMPISYYTLDSKTGQQCLFVHGRITLLPEGTILPYLIFRQLYDFALDIVDVMLYERKGATNFMISNLSSGLFDYYQSCAEDFKIRLKQTRVIPKFQIVSNDGKLVYSTAKLVELYSIPIFQQKLHFSQEIFRDVKIHLIIHQISKLLRDEGFQTTTISNGLYILKPFVISAVFQINSSFYWSLKIRPLKYLTKDEHPVIVFTGNTITCRFCRQVVSLFNSIYAYSDLKNHFELTLSIYEGITQVSYLTSTFIKVNINNRFPLFIGFPPYKNSMILESCNYIKVSSFFAEKMIFRFPHFLSLPKWDRFALLPFVYPGIGSFISGMLPFIIEFKCLFLSNSDWTCIFNESISDAILTFHGIITLLVQVKPKRLLFCRFSARGPSSFLIHALKIPGLKIEDRRVFYIFKSTIPQFKQIITKIEDNFALFKKFRDMSLHSFKNQNDQLIAASLDKNVFMILKCDKNYIMQFRQSPVASEISKKIASLPTITVTQKIDMNYFIYMVMNQIYGESALILLNVLPIREVNWLDIKDSAFIGRDKAMLKLTGISENRTICITITNGHIISQDQKKRMTPNDLRIIMSNNSNLQTLFKLFQ